MKSDKQSMQLKHGVLMNIFNYGVLITGISGIGKSETALTLIDRGHLFIADDQIECREAKDSKGVIGVCPVLLRDHLHVFGLGILNIRRLYGEDAILSEQTIHLVIELISLTEEHIEKMRTLKSMQSTERILQFSLPKISIPITPGRQTATLIETCVRQKCIIDECMSEAFIRQQQKAIEDNEPCSL